MARGLHLLVLVVVYTIGTRCGTGVPVSHSETTAAQVQTVCTAFYSTEVDDLLKAENEARVARSMSVANFPADLKDRVGTFYMGSRSSAQRVDDRSAVVDWCSRGI